MAGRQVRFWIWENGSWAKLTLHQGRPISRSMYAEHDEGWGSTHTKWTLAGDQVIRSYESDGVDCDGRLQTYATDVCPVDDLKAVLVQTSRLHCGEFLRMDVRVQHSYNDCEVVWRPDWQDVSKSQRDHSAEAMGY